MHKENKLNPIRGWEKNMRPGPNPIKLFSASIYATLKRQPIREAQRGRVTTLIGHNFSVASIEAGKSFIGLGPGFILGYMFLL